MSEIKDKRRTLLLIAGAALAVSVAAFLYVLLNGGGSAYELCSRETARFLAAPSAETAVRAELSMARADRQMAIRETGTVRRAGGESAVMAAELRMDYFGESYERKLFFSDGVLYSDFGDQKLKAAVDTQEAQTLFCLVPFEFPAQAVKSSSVTRKGDGGKDAEMLLDPVMTRDFLMERVMSMDDMSGLEAATFDFTEAKAIAEFDEEGRLKSRLLTINAAVDLNGEEASLIYELEWQVLKTEGATVEAPPDRDAYREAPEDGDSL
jgi:hypothetical protein